MFSPTFELRCGKYDFLNDVHLIINKQRGLTVIHVFIGYGGARAEDVAERVNSFLNGEKQINTFLASPRTHHLLSTDEWRAEVNSRLLDCNLAIFVCHENTSRSSEIKREIDFLFDYNMESKIIVFANTDTCIPRKVRQRWHPLHFPPEKPDESFCRLLNEIFRCYIKIVKSTRARLIREHDRMVV